MSKCNLIGDIGATNARFAIVDDGEYKLQNIRYLPCTEYSAMQDAIEKYLSEFSGIEIATACFAIAGASHTETFKLANNDWKINKGDVVSALNNVNVTWVNDFTAQAIATTMLSEDDIIVINPGSIQNDRARLAIGPGTGLGVCGLIPASNEWVPVMGEGGHVDFAPNSQLQFEIFSLLQKQFEHVSVERVLSGPGIVNLYKSLAIINGQQSIFDTPAEITNAANDAKPDQLCFDTLQLFCQIFGSVAGNAALNVGALGGVYITGGVIRNFVDLFINSDFQKSFEDKGRLSDYMADIPIHLSEARYMGLLGAAKILNK
jgi:glucokinase